MTVFLLLPDILNPFLYRLPQRLYTAQQISPVQELPL
nr:MAG TPA: hypothetical protein [Caudoviricetes sp.]